MGGDVVEVKRAFALHGAALAEREQTAEPAIGGAVARVGEQARRVFKIEARADDELDAADLLAPRDGRARRRPACCGP